MFNNNPDVGEILAIPEKCRDCPVQCELQARMGELLMAQQAMGSFGEALVGKKGEKFDEMIDATLPREVADEMKEVARKRVGFDLEKVDENIDETRQEIDAIALSCSGVLKMRATKGDVTYTVSLCTSPRVYLRDGGPAHTPSHIQADSAQRAK